MIRMVKDDSDSTLDLMRKVFKIDEEDGPGHEVYVIEECSELIKELAKDQRWKGKMRKIIEEGCDVIGTVYSHLRFNYGVTDEEIEENIRCKMIRAIERYEKKGEV